MSLSHTPAPQEPKMPQFAVSAIPAVPALEKKAEPAKPSATTAPGTEEPPAKAEKPAAAAAAPSRKIKWLEVLLDTVLVLMVAGVLGGGAYYLKTEWDKYRVPTAMELAYEECEQLCTQRESLLEAFNHADEQLHMRTRLSALDTRIAQLDEEAAQLSSAIATHQNRILALQHEIRRADRDSRSVARGLLPGMPLGDITTKSGKTYRSATISRINGKQISLRTAYGAATLPIAELPKDKLPELVLYALGNIDLVDMTDFTSTGDVPTQQPRSNPKLRRVTPRANSASGYEPASTGPVVNTQSNKESLIPDSAPELPAFPQSPGKIWQAPTGDLPL